MASSGFLFLRAFLIKTITLSTAFLRRRLKTLLRLETRIAFLALDVIGMAAILAKYGKKCKNETMIGHLKGITIDKNERYLVLEVASVGYKVFATSETIESSPLLEVRSLWMHHAVREDASDLYGFATRDELNFFELLIGISGIGPRTALGILNVTTVSALKKAVSSGDTSHLVKVSGIGKKNAEKIVLELKDKFDKDDSTTTFKEEVDALEALKSLGFSHNEAREALKQVTEEVDTGAKVKKALKILGK